MKKKCNMINIYAIVVETKTKLQGFVGMWAINITIVRAPGWGCGWGSQWG